MPLSRLPLNASRTESLTAALKTALGDKLVSATVALGEVTLVVKAGDLLGSRDDVARCAGAAASSS